MIQSHNILLMPSAQKPAGKRASWTEDELDALIQKPKIQAKKGGQCFTFGTFSFLYRDGGNIISLSAVGLDYDKETDIQAAPQVWRDMGLRFWLYTTFSHTPDSPKFRIIFPLAKELDPADFKILWRWLEARAKFPLDKTCNDVVRLWYPPAHAKGADYYFESNPGQPLDWTEIVAEGRALKDKQRRLAEERREALKNDARKTASGSALLSRKEKYAQAAVEGELAFLRAASDGEKWFRLRHASLKIGSLIKGGYGSLALREELLSIVQSLGAKNMRTAERCVDDAFRDAEPREIPDDLFKEEMSECQDQSEALHCSEDIRKPVSSGIVETICDGKITFELRPAERGQVVLTVRRGADILAVDTLSLQNAGKRAAYVAALNLSDEEAREVNKALLEMATRPAAAPIAKHKEEKHVTFAQLSDGRLIEQLAGGRFVVFDGAQPDFKTQISYANEVIDGDVVYCPDSDPYLTEQNELKFPDDVEEYGTVQELDGRIAKFLHEFVEIPQDRQARIVAGMARLSWIQDLLREVPYLHATGEKGSGKSRLLKLIALLSYRPLLSAQMSGAVLFRVCDKYGPVIVWDEFNIRTDNDDTQAVLQVLNAGFDRDLAKVYRTEKTADGNFTQRMYRCFGMKFFGGLQTTDSEAFQSRAIEVRLSATTRDDIQFVNTGKIEQQAAGIRRQLQLWRLRNYRVDWMARLIEAERFLRAKEEKQPPILPRFVQIGSPLMMLLEDEDTRESFKNSLRERTTDDTERRQDSLEGRIIHAIHVLCFGDTEPGTLDGELIIADALREGGKPCEALLVSKLEEAINADLSERDKISLVRLGKRLSALGIKTRKIQSRPSKHYDKKAIIWDADSLEKAFTQYHLPSWGKLSVCTVCKTDNHQQEQQDKAQIGENTTCLQKASADKSKNNLSASYPFGYEQIAGIADSADKLPGGIAGNGSQKDVSETVRTSKPARKVKVRV